MAETFDIDAVEAALRGLLRGEFSSLTIGFNEQHAPNYDTAQKWADDFPQSDSHNYNDVREWPSEEDRLKAIRDNSVWSLQWYPDTPVGFCNVYASTLRGVIELAVKEAGAETPASQ
jgi:hypothetical protein